MNEMRPGYARGLLGGALLGLFAVAPAPASAQELDDRWLPWVGCWEPMQESQEGEERALVCFRPAEGGVEMFTFLDGELQTSDVVYTDGRAREVSREGCSGTESAEFSQDGRRVFLSGRMSCGNDVARNASGVMSLTAPTQWLDVRSVEVEGESVAWVQRYMLASPETMQEAGVVDPAAGREMAVRTARMVASRRVDADDVVEATQKVDAKAVEAWVAERGERFELDAGELVRLAEAGVPGSVTDVMVAVSYPYRFDIDPEGRASQRERVVDADRRAYRGYGYYGPFFWDPFYYGYSPFYGRFRYGYGPYGFYDPIGYRPTTVIVEPSRPRGRLVPGRGYVPTSGSATGRTARPRSSAGASGGGSRATGRTARPRRGGSDFQFRPSASRSPAPAVSRASSGSSRPSGRTARRRGGGG